MTLEERLTAAAIILRDAVEKFDAEQAAREAQHAPLAVAS
ncbi:hypothetical protein J2X55_002288 [Microbacterium sp. 1154]|nr:hypothetical protein [Microbacterium sp. 1154]